MDRTPNLLHYLRQEPDDLEWATARPRRDKSQENRTPSGTAKEAQQPLALLEHYCTEGKISHSHIDDRCLSYMRNLHPDVQCQALTEYANRRSKDTLNNPPAYFMSLLQSLESAAHRSHVLKKKKSIREGVTSNLAAASEKLLQDLQNSGVIGEFELDSACLSHLAKLPSNQQIQVLEQYANIKHWDQLRCNAAFFMGLLKQVAEKKQTPPVLVVPKSVPVDLTFVSPEAKHKLAELYTHGVMEPALMDQHCMGLLAALPKAAQLCALGSIAANIGDEENKRGYVTQLLKNMRASAVSIAGTASKARLQQHPKAGSTAVGSKVLSNTGKLINPNEVSIRLNPSSIFYDAELAMCWRVLTKQDKSDWQTRLAKGKQMKLTDLSQPRQKLAQQLQPGHPQYDAATASGWRYTDVSAKEELLQSADESGEAIQLMPQQTRPPPAAETVEPEFHEIDFPPLGGQIELSTHKAAGSGSDIGFALSGPVSDYTCLEMGLQTDNDKLGISGAAAGDAGPQILPLYNMGMAFQQSLSLQDINKSDPSNLPSTDCLASVSAAGLTSRSDALDAFGHGHDHAPQAKPITARRPALQSVSTNSPNHMPNSLPFSSGPFPSITKNLHSHPGLAQVPSYMQQTHKVSAAPGNAIAAQHALGLLHSGVAHTSCYTSSLAQGSMQSQMTPLHHQTDVNSMSGVQGMSHQTSNRALDRDFGAVSPSSSAPGSENLMCSFAPHYVASTQPQAAPGTAPTATNSGKSDNAYVSFDEWRAQVHAKKSLAYGNSTASTGSVRLLYDSHRFDPQPLSWLPSAKAPDFQCSR